MVREARREAEELYTAERNYQMLMEIYHTAIERACGGTHWSLRAARRGAALLQIANKSGLTTPDGRSVVWILRLMGYRYVQRVYGPDLMLEVCQASLARGLRHFLYAGGPGVAERLRDRLASRF